MRKIRFVLLLSAAVVAASATPWNRSVDANLTANQSAYSDNWGGGETGLFTCVFGSNMLAEKQLSSKTNTRTTLKLAFGQTYRQETTKAWAAPAKSADQIDLESVLRFTLGAWVDPFVAARLESQFLDHSDPALTRYVNPLKLTESFGIARSFLKSDKRELISRLGGGLKQGVDRLVLDTTSKRRGTVSANYGGLTFATDFTTPIAGDRITYLSKLSVFQALFSTEAARLKGLPNANYWRSPDVGWENTLTASITKLLMVNFYIQILYDKEIDVKARLQENLALGITYRLI